MNNFKIKITANLIEFLTSEVENNTLQMLMSEEHAVTYINNQGSEYTEGETAFFDIETGFKDDALIRGDIDARGEFTYELLSDLGEYEYYLKEPEEFEVLEIDKVTRYYRFVYRKHQIDTDIVPFSLDDEIRFYRIKTSVAFDRKLKLLRV